MADRDVLWITIESLRRDHTSAGDIDRDPTPNLARLAVNGRSFDTCFSHDIWTRSSTASILTGYPSSAHQTWSNEAKLPDEITTIPEAFRDAGYRTACVTSNGQLSSMTGLDRGFDRFHYLNRSTLLEELGIRNLGRWLLNARSHSGGFTRDQRKHSLGYLVNRLANGHIDSAAESDDPVFLYVHHNDTHHAYVPPVTWRDRFIQDIPMSLEDAIALALDMSDRLHECIAADDPFEDDEWQALRTLYDTSIAYVDQLVGELVDHARCVLQDPIVVVTADHGELFGEQGLLAHMLVTNTSVSNVPLVVTGLDGLPESGLIQHADVMQMLCTELEIEHPVPAGRDIRNRPRKYAITQRGGTRSRNKLEAIRTYNDQFDHTAFHRGDLTSIRTESWRCQISDDRSELFSLPDETQDVTDEFPGVAQRLREQAGEWLASVGEPVGDAGAAQFDDATTEHLRDLGYLQ